MEKLVESYQTIPKKKFLRISRNTTQMPFYLAIQLCWKSTLAITLQHMKNDGGIATQFKTSAGGLLPSILPEAALSVFQRESRILGRNLDVLKTAPVLGA